VHKHVRSRARALLRLLATSKYAVDASVEPARGPAACTMISYVPPLRAGLTLLIVNSRSVAHLPTLCLPQ